MKTKMQKSIAVAFHNWMQNNPSEDGNIEVSYEKWWDIHGQRFFETSMPENLTILEEANRIIFDRDDEKNRQYGPFSDSIAKTARVATELCNKHLSTEDVFKVLISMKISRMSYNHKHDTMLDAIGYIAGLDSFLKGK